MTKTQSRSAVVHLPLTRDRIGKALLQGLEIVRVVSSDDSGTVVDLAPLGLPATAARSIMEPGSLIVGDEVVVAFVRGDGAQPLIVGRIHNPGAPARDVRINGRRIAIQADAELVLRCANATVRIERDGQVSVRGERIVSQARGSHRVRGGSVELN